MTGVMIKMTAQVGKRDELLAHLTETAQIAETEAGTLLWTIHASPIEADIVYLYEVYTDDMAKQAHESSAAYAEAKAQTGTFLTGSPDVIPLVPIAGKGLKK